MPTWGKWQAYYRTVSVEYDHSERITSLVVRLASRVINAFACKLDCNLRTSVATITARPL